MFHYVPKVIRRPTCVLSSSLGLEKMVHWVREASEQKKKKVVFFHEQNGQPRAPPAAVTCYRWVPTTHETSPRCGGATVPPCNHSGCPTTPSKAILKHMTTPYGTLYQISNFPREQNTIILNRPQLHVVVTRLLSQSSLPL